MTFSLLTPPPYAPSPPPLGTPFWGGGVGDWGGSKILCMLRPLCVDLGLSPEELFSCIWTPPTHGGGSGSKLWVTLVTLVTPPGPPEPLPFFRWMGCLVAPKTPRRGC